MAAPPMLFLHGLQPNVTTNYNRGVGSETPARPLYTFGGAGAIYYVALNGSDANTGLTPAQAFLTVTHASTVAGAADGILLIRNGYVGELLWQEAGAFTVAAAELATEDGETATIEVASNAVMTVNAGTSLFNTRFISPERLSPIPVILAGPGGFITMSNCTVETNRSCAGWGLVTTTRAIKAFYCLFVTNTDVQVTVQGALLLPANSDSRFENCTFVHTDTLPTGVALSLQNTGVQHQIDFINCLFYNQRYVVVYDGEPVQANQCTITFQKCDIIAKWLSLNFTTNFRQYYLASCHTRLSKEREETISGGGGISVFVERGAISPAWRSLFADERNARTDVDPEGFRLQWRWKVDPGGGWFHITSPLVGASVAVAADATLTPPFPAVAAGDDITPYDEDTTFAGFAFTLSTEIDRPVNTWTRQATLANYFRITDLRGDAKADYDAARRVWSFDFSQSTGMLNVFRLIALSQDKGALLWFPRNGQNVFIDPATCEPAADEGVWANADNSFDPTILLGGPMVKNKWAGWWIFFNNDYYYIISNDDQKMFLSDRSLFGSGFPVDGTYAFEIQMMLLKPTQDTIEILQEFAVNFEYGSGFREPATNAGLAFEQKLAQITFEELAYLQPDFR